eukprot:COSAG03_NODE_34_length_17821_cov_18.833531_6_plen_162_part_00
MLSCASARERHSVSAPPHACWPQLHGSRTIMWPSARNRFLLQCAMRLCDAAVSAACSHSTSCFHRSHQGAVDSSMRCVVVASCLVVAIPRWRSRHTPGLAGRPAVRAARNRIRESSMTPCGTEHSVASSSRTRTRYHAGRRRHSPPMDQCHSECVIECCRY